MWRGLLIYSFDSTNKLCAMPFDIDYFLVLLRQVQQFVYQWGTWERAIVIPQDCASIHLHNQYMRGAHCSSTARWCIGCSQKNLLGAKFEIYSPAKVELEPRYSYTVDSVHWHDWPRPWSWPVLHGRSRSGFHPWHGWDPLDLLFVPSAWRVFEFELK